MTVSTGHCAWAIRQSEKTEPSIRISLFLRAEGIRPFLSLRISRIILDLDCCKIYFTHLPQAGPQDCAHFCAYHQTRRVATDRDAIARKALSRAAFGAIRRMSSLTGQVIDSSCLANLGSGG